MMLLELIGMKNKGGESSWCNGYFTPLQKCSWCILQLQLIGLGITMGSVLDLTFFNYYIFHFRNSINVAYPFRVYITYWVYSGFILCFSNLQLCRSLSSFFLHSSITTSILSASSCHHIVCISFVISSRCQMLSDPQCSDEGQL